MLKKIVQFPNGQYAYRKCTLFGYVYLDLQMIGEVWWPSSSNYFEDCLTFNLSDLKNILKFRFSKGIPIDDQNLNT